jgi:hypothetical protein
MFYMIATIGFQGVGQALQSSGAAHNASDVVLSNEKACHTEITLVVFMGHQSERAVLQHALCHKFRPAQSLHTEQDPIYPALLRTAGFTLHSSISLRLTLPLAPSIPSTLAPLCCGAQPLRGVPPQQCWTSVHTCVHHPSRPMCARPSHYEGFNAISPGRVYVCVCILDHATTLANMISKPLGPHHLHPAPTKSSAAIPF